jgi:protein-S-isoprenylcysteine O-methyltransferase Ste14
LPGKSSSTWLALRSLFWTIAFPGFFAGFVPWQFFGLRDVRVAALGPSQIAALACIGAGVVLLALCIVEFARSGKGTLSPLDPPRTLVVRGLYRYVRNPMYLSVTLIILGEAMLMRSSAMVVYWAIWFIWVNVFVVGYEEPTLRRMFGASYEEYTRRVGRWIPKLIALVAVAMCQVGAQSQSDLSGSWTPVPSEYRSTKELTIPDSNAPPAPPALSGAPQLPAIRIVHAEPSFTLEYVAADGTTISTQRLTTDNRENVNMRGGGALTQRSSSRWESGALRTEWRLLRGDQPIMSGVDRWQLSADGATLIHTSTMEDSKSRSQTATVYRRSQG